MPASSLPKRFLGFIAVAAACIAPLASSATADASPTPSVASTAAAVSASADPWLAQQLSQYAGAQYGPYANGVWANSAIPAASPWSINDGPPATVAATLYVLGGESNATYLGEAESTLKTAIANEQAVNGGFVAPSWDTTSESTTTMWFGVEVGTAYELLAPYVDTATRTAWQNSLAAAATYLINGGGASWYANGNLNIGYTELLWMAWHATGDSRFLSAYNASWQFVMDPPQNQWAGDGWYTTKAATSSDGAGGRGYFAEIGAGGTGFDPYYATLQLDILARLYLFSGDQRALQAANMIMDMELPLLNTSTWVLNTSNGTRHTGTDSSEFLTSAFAVLGLEGNRSDLLSDIVPHLKQYETWYGWVGQTDNATFRRAFGNSIDTIALAAAYANPAQQGLVARYGWLGAISGGATVPPGSLTPAAMPVGPPASSPTASAAAKTHTGVSGSKSKTKKSKNAKNKKGPADLSGRLGA